MSDDSTDFDALTPGHFLRGAPLVAFPEIPTSDISLINRWEKLKRLHQELCVRWKEEYLKLLHKRYKWKTPRSDIQINDLVVVKDELLPPQEWRLGRVLNVYKGPDSLTRVVDIKTQNGIIIRPIVKICVLPTKAPNQERLVGPQDQ